MTPEPSAVLLAWYMLNAQIGLLDLTWAGDAGRVSVVSPELVWAPGRPFSASFTLWDELGVDHVDEATCTVVDAAHPSVCQTGLQAERGFDVTCITPFEERGIAVSPVPETRAQLRKFILGEPMKLATKRLAGR